MSEMSRERDLVLSPNEYAYVLDKTKGLISCVVGSYKMSLSNSDALVVFNEKTKKFEESSFSEAITTFVSAPENWYVILKNPALENKHPTTGTSNALPELQIGKKINIKGNTSFALYPGQMAKVIQGHRLHSNQYLLARVYDADALEKEESKDEDGNSTYKNKYTTGQILVIKGTDVSFYIPPTGIEVIPIGGYGDQYIRDAVTLERLEYCVLKNEKGAKKYIHGAAVVFPQPDEQFLKNPAAKDTKDIYKFKAIELSDISGIYVKVIADYKENGKEYKTGEELFITGKDQMIYYPRPEHAVIDYEGHIVHHAIAIPMGEGRYVLDRLKGNIKLVKGPVMYLPDPRYEVVVQRKLSKKECTLWYPKNNDVLEYNTGIKVVEDDDDYEYEHRHRSTVVDSGFSRSNTYTKPRTITIDNKYEGAVAITVWTGYAVNVVSKNGTRKVVTGPTTYLMEYDETLEAISLSSGKPKTTDKLINDVYLRVDNNKISDIINVQTKDFVDVSVKVSYCVDFLEEYKDKWFNVENYVKYMTDRQRSLLKMEAKKHSIEDFYENTTSIVRKTLLNLNDEGEGEGRLFTENGMLVKDVEVLSVSIEEDVEEIINRHQFRMVEKSLELTNADKTLEVAKKLAEAEKQQAELRNTNELYKLELENKLAETRIKKQEEIARMQEASRKAEKTAEKEIQVLLDAIQKAELARQKERTEIELQKKKDTDALDIAKEKSRTENIKKVIDTISPDLVAAMTSKSNAELMEVVAKAMSPYAIAKDTSVADVTDQLLRGTTLEGLIETIAKNKSDEY